MEPISLSPHSDLKVYRPPIEYFTDRLRARSHFAFAKLNHAFWEVVATYRDGDQPTDEPAHLKGGWLRLHGVEMLNQLLHIARNPDGLLMGVSHLGPPHEDYEPHIPFSEPLRAIRENVTRYVPLYGQLWKWYAVNGEMPKLFDALKGYHVVGVGLDHLSSLGEKVGLTDYSHFLVGFTANDNRRQIAHDLKFYHHRLGRPAAYLFQCGECVSAWIIHALRKMPNAVLIDLGRSIDMFIEDRKIRPEYLKFVPDFNRQLWLGRR